MKRKTNIVAIALTIALAISLTGCSKSSTSDISKDDVEAALEKADEAIANAESTEASNSIVVEQSEPEEVVEEIVEEEELEEPEEVREGFYRSELTNEWTDVSIMAQRPIAVMVDNEIKALPHYGTSKADVVYEMMNSTLNDRITRFMCIFKDYNNIDQIGSIRSVRTTNLQLSPEFNAFVIHDGGPLYIEAYFKAPYVEHLSGGFARIKNGKPTEFTEYITPGEVTKRAEAAGIGLEYNEYYQGPHWQFVSENKPIDLASVDNSIAVNTIQTPYKHNRSRLEYQENEGVYRYSEYGDEYIDALTNEHLEFKNVILQESKFIQFDEHGYMNFLIHEGEGMHGYYITNGHGIPITWYKDKYDMFPTVFYDEAGNVIKLNTGKTYVCIIPDDQWEQLEIQ